jgi:hypothetical protein
MRIAAWALFLSIVSAAAGGAQQPAHGPATFTILHFTDVYEITPVEGG